MTLYLTLWSARPGYLVFCASGAIIDEAAGVILTGLGYTTEAQEMYSPTYMSYCRNEGSLMREDYGGVTYCLEILLYALCVLGM
jgi:hypothetical protein